jgi:hypothetical protein
MRAGGLRPFDRCERPPAGRFLSFMQAYRGAGSSPANGIRLARLLNDTERRALGQVGRFILA